MLKRAAAAWPFDAWDIVGIAALVGLGVGIAGLFGFYAALSVVSGLLLALAVLVARSPTE